MSRSRARDVTSRGLSATVCQFHDVIKLMGVQCQNTVIGTDNFCFYAVVTCEIKYAAGSVSLRTERQSTRMSEIKNGIG